MTMVFAAGPRNLPRFTVLGRADAHICCSAGLLVLEQNRKITANPVTTALELLTKEVPQDSVSHNSKSILPSNFRHVFLWCCCCCCIASLPGVVEPGAELLKLLLTGWSNPGTIYVQVMHSHVTSRILLSNWSIFLLEQLPLPALSRPYPVLIGG